MLTKTVSDQLENSVLTTPDDVRKLYCSYLTWHIKPLSPLCAQTTLDHPELPPALSEKTRLITCPTLGSLGYPHASVAD